MTRQRKTTTEGTTFVTEEFAKLNTVKKWIAAFPERYAGLSAKVARAFAIRDMRSAK